MLSEFIEETGMAIYLPRLHTMITVVPDRVTCKQLGLTGYQNKYYNAFSVVEGLCIYA